jgi:hypothetical protein
MTSVRLTLAKWRISTMVKTTPIIMLPVVTIDVIETMSIIHYSSVGSVNLGLKSLVMREMFFLESLVLLTSKKVFIISLKENTKIAMNHIPQNHRDRTEEKMNDSGEVGVT